MLAIMVIPVTPVSLCKAPLYALAAEQLVAMVLLSRQRIRDYLWNECGIFWQSQYYIWLVIEKYSSESKNITIIINWNNLSIRLCEEFQLYCHYYSSLWWIPSNTCVAKTCLRYVKLLIRKGSSHTQFKFTKVIQYAFNHILKKRYR